MRRERQRPCGKVWNKGGDRQSLSQPTKCRAEENIGRTRFYNSPSQNFFYPLIETPNDQRIIAGDSPTPTKEPTHDPKLGSEESSGGI